MLDPFQNSLQNGAGALMLHHVNRTTFVPRAHTRTRRAPQGLQLRTAGETCLTSSDKILLRSPRGILLSAEEEQEQHQEAAWARGDATGARGKHQRGQHRPEEGGHHGHILLTPATGSGVGIGPGFSSRDLVGEPGARRHARGVFTFASVCVAGNASGLGEGGGDPGKPM